MLWLDADGLHRARDEHDLFRNGLRGTILAGKDRVSIPGHHDVIAIAGSQHCASRNHLKGRPDLRLLVGAVGEHERAVDVVLVHLHRSACTGVTVHHTEVCEQRLDAGDGDLEGLRVFMAAGLDLEHWNLTSATKEAIGWQANLSDVDVGDDDVDREATDKFDVPAVFEAPTADDHRAGGAQRAMNVETHGELVPEGLQFLRALHFISVIMYAAHRIFGQTIEVHVCRSGRFLFCLGCRGEEGAGSVDVVHGENDSSAQNAVGERHVLQQVPVGDASGGFVSMCEGGDTKRRPGNARVDHQNALHTIGAVCAHDVKASLGLLY